MIKGLVIFCVITACVCTFCLGYEHSKVVNLEKYILSLDSPLKINVVDDKVQLIVPRWLNMVSGEHVGGMGKMDTANKKYDTFMVWNCDKDKRYHIVWDTLNGLIMDSIGIYRTNPAILKISSGFKMFKGVAPSIFKGKIHIGFDTTKHMAYKFVPQKGMAGYHEIDTTASDSMRIGVWYEMYEVPVMHHQIDTTNH